MAEWEGKTRGGIAGYKIFVFLLAHFPLSFVYFILRFVVVYYFFNSRKSFRFIYFYYRRAHHYSALRSFFKVYSSYYSFGQVLIDKTIVLSGASHNFTYNFDGEEYLRDLTADGKGGILMGAHMGGWDMAGFLLKRLDYKVNIMIYDAEHRNIKEFLSQTYAGNDLNEKINFILIKDDLSHLIEMRNALRNGELLTMLADRHMEGHKTIQHQFMGLNTYFPEGPFIIPLRFDFPVTFVYTLKESKTHYHFFATRPKVYKNISGTGDEQADLKILLSDYISTLEHFVKEYPNQWFNFYDFWKKPSE